jgi:hypothetical protein
MFITGLAILLAGASVQAQIGFTPIDKAGEYDIGVQDDENGYYMLFNSKTGDYEFERCSDGVEFHGTGEVTVKDCEVILEDASFNRYILATVDLCEQNGKCVVRVFKGMKTIPYVPPMLEIMSDSNLKDNTWDCSGWTPPVLFRR